MKKVKEWVKKYKKEIIIGVTAVVGGASLYFLIKNKAAITGKISLNIRFDNDEDLGMRKWKCRDYYNITINDSDLKLSDLGKLGEMIGDALPIIKADDASISSISTSYSKNK